MAFASRHSVALFLALVALASVRIVATYTVFNHTIDEPAHIACGMEWLDKKVYRYEPQHPPLARVMVALGPYLAGAHAWGKRDMNDEGGAILYTGNRYDRMLALARLGILPFFWLGALVVYLWARRSFGEAAAFFTTLCFTFIPPVLAHAGLATTDMALAVTLGAAFLAMLAWAGRPSWTRSVLFGAALAAAILSKFSALAFFPAVALSAVVFYVAIETPSPAQVLAWIRPRLLPLALAAVVASTIVWAGYRFSFDKWPAPELFAGVRAVMDHNRKGHPGYLLGENRDTGWWYFYPVVLSVKTPLALLGLLGIGAVICWKRRGNTAYWIPLAFPVGILAIAAFSRINIGVRHVLPVYLAFSIVAGVGAEWLWSSGVTARWILAGLLLWMTASSALSHPDYLPYFNALAGNRPERIAVNSDLDWGQDMKRLAARLREVGAAQVAFDPLIVARLEAVHGFPHIQRLNPQAPAPGWNAVSLTMLKVFRMGLNQNYPDFKLWTDRIPPTERVGKGVLLWYIPPGR